VESREPIRSRITLTQRMVSGQVECSVDDAQILMEARAVSSTTAWKQSHRINRSSRLDD
jgi:hypothetical protein